jgi:hypothetical protein
VGKKNVEKPSLKKPLFHTGGRGYNILKEAKKGG